VAVQIDQKPSGDAAVMFRAWDHEERMLGAKGRTEREAWRDAHSNGVGWGGHALSKEVVSGGVGGGPAC
jgi:hypothetical protein